MTETQMPESRRHPEAAGNRMGRHLPVVLLVVLGVAAFANSFGNSALFHFAPSYYTDAVLDNSMLRSPQLFPKIFTGEFLPTTGGEYRPLGYALFALLARLIPAQSPGAWHAAMLSLSSPRSIRAGTTPPRPAPSPSGPWSSCFWRKGRAG